MTYKKFFFFVIVAIFSCNSISHEKSLSTDQYTSLVKKFPNIFKKNIVVYSFDGDCSFCIAQMILLENKYKNSEDTNTLFIANTENAVLLQFQLSKEHISNPNLIIQNETQKDTTIQKVFEIGNMYLINKSREVEKYELK